MGQPDDRPQADDRRTTPLLKVSHLLLQSGQLISKVDASRYRVFRKQIYARPTRTLRAVLNGIIIT